MLRTKYDVNLKLLNEEEPLGLYTIYSKHQWSLVTGTRGLHKGDDTLTRLLNQYNITLATILAKMRHELILYKRVNGYDRVYDPKHETNVEYRTVLKEKNKIQQKKYNATEILCDCGKTTTKGKKWQHEKTAFHKENKNKNKTI